jgi:glucose-6-phosphate 1-dehydrogenase
MSAINKNIIFILFGATGDLAVKKIFPALQALLKERAISPASKIIAVSRRDWNDSDLIQFLKDKKVSIDQEFESLISYSKIDIEGNHGYEDLKKKISGLKKEVKSAETYFYLSLAPQNHPLAVASLKEHKILSKGKNKVLIEKPFGTNERTAKDLDSLLSYLNPSQVCRVDHYLGKDSIQALMDLHEKTPDFDKIISNQSVASIRLSIFETKGIDNRGATYDSVGAFRDVGQNHMLEMLGVIASSLSGGNWQKARTEVFTHLEPPAKTCEFSRRGQYDSYHLETGVKPGSETETAFEIKTTLYQGKLKGTPLILEAGKAMQKSEVFTEITFKDIPGIPKKMIFKVQPEQEITIVNGDGARETFVVPKKRDAYANLLYAALTDSTREFVGPGEIEALWRYADRIVACWNKVPLEIYGPDKPFLPLYMQ